MYININVCVCRAKTAKQMHPNMRFPRILTQKKAVQDYTPRPTPTPTPTRACSVMETPGRMFGSA